MSGEARISEREAVMRERRAFRAGAMFQETRHRSALRCQVSVNLAWAEDECEKRYPIPKVTRPRVYSEGFHHWAFIDGEFCYAYTNGDPHSTAEWRKISDMCYSALLCEDFEAFADAYTSLRGNPTELVDDPDPGVSS